MLPYSSAFYSRTAPLHPVLVLETQGLPQSLETTLKNCRNPVNLATNLKSCYLSIFRVPIFPCNFLCSWWTPNPTQQCWCNAMAGNKNQKIPTFNSSSSSPVIRCSKRLLSLLHRHASLEPIRTGWVVGLQVEDSAKTHETRGIHLKLTQLQRNDRRLNHNFPYVNHVIYRRRTAEQSLVLLRLKLFSITSHENSRKTQSVHMLLPTTADGSANSIQNRQSLKCFIPTLAMNQIAKNRFK